MKRDIAHYGDCDVFKPGERWRSPRGTNYFVEGVQVGGMATLRTLTAPWASPYEVRMGCRIGRLRKVPWDGVINWVRYAPAPNPNPAEKTND